MPFPYIFTFYSFKGGVGRSMALMNVAYTLAGWGRHVLIVDMDLEAPGVSGFLERNQELEPAPGANPKDILSFLHESLLLLNQPGSPQEKAEGLPPLKNYRRAVKAEKLGALKPRLGQLGRLDVLGADSGDGYAARLAELGFKDLTFEQIRELSDILHSYFKGQRFPHRPLGIEEFEEPIETPYDYVLVDSRTGLTEIGGLCVGELADRLVVVTGLNDQNIEGTRLFLKEAGIGPRRQDGKEPRWDDADVPQASEDAPPTLGPKPTLLVASPVPIGEIAFKRERLKLLEKKLDIRPFAITYHPQLAFIETVFVRDCRGEFLSREYGSLTKHIMSLVRDDVQSLTEDARARSSDEKDLRGAIHALLRLAPAEPSLGEILMKAQGNLLAEAIDAQLRFSMEARGLSAHLAMSLDPRTSSTAFLQLGSALSGQANEKKGAEADRLFEGAYAKYAEAVRLKPDFPVAFNNWANALSDHAKQKQDAEADRLYEEASRNFEKAVRLKPDSSAAFFNWGAALSDQAKQKQGAKADRLFEEAYAKHAEAVRLKPDFPEAFNNWGNALSDHAKQKQGAEADRLLEEASRKYEEALRLKPDFAEIFSNWGAALSEQAKQKKGAEADRLFEEAYAQCAEAVRLKPDSPEAFSTWGGALTLQANQKKGAEADGLFEAAYDKFAEAVRLKPDFPHALNAWGTALLFHAQQKQGAEADQLRQEALKLVLQTEKLEPGRGAYNLACLEALQGSAEVAVRWLRAAKEHGLLTKRQIAEDRDFDLIRDDPRLIEFLESIDSGQESTALPEQPA